jgi:hypothetical protein
LTTQLITSLAVVFLAANPAVSVRPLDGEPLQGELVGVTAKQLAVQTAAGPKQLPIDQVMRVDFAATAPAQKPSVWVELLDGSRLTATAFTSSGGTAQVTLATGGELALPTRAIHTVRFYAQSAELAVQWREITSSMATGDVLVIRKTFTRTVEQGENEPRTVTEYALDQIEGTIIEVTADSVRFELDGAKHDARREKLEGIVYYRPAKREFPAAFCRLNDAAGSTLLLASLELADQKLTGSTLGGVSVEFPLSDISRLDFSVGNVAFLSDLTPDSGAGESAVSLQPAAMTYKFSRIFQLRAAPPLGADGFRMGGERYESGLSVHSPAKLVYRVPSGFRKFYAVAGIDDSVLAPGGFALVVLADGKEVARHDFSAEKRKAVPITLDVGQVRRLTILLEPGDGQDIGDQLNLCEARFTK